jgi:hypothetical protein
MVEGAKKYPNPSFPYSYVLIFTIAAVVLHHRCTHIVVYEMPVLFDFLKCLHFLHIIHIRPDALLVVNTAKKFIRMPLPGKRAADGVYKVHKNRGKKCLKRLE